VSADLADLFPGFASHWIDTAAGRIFARAGGGGPPLMHGYAQTNVMWHKVAPALAKRFSLVIPDLPGYGWSDAPDAAPDHAPYTKRAMAAAMVDVMEKLGHARFALAGHDRGGRVAYRLALDNPGRLTRLATLDIVPTWHMWHDLDARLAFRIWRRTFLALPAPGRDRYRPRRGRLLGREARPGHQVEGSLRVRSARARALPRVLPGPEPHPCDLRGLPRRPHHRSRARRGRPRGGKEDRLSAARDLGFVRHSERDQEPARHLARMGEGCARLRDRLRALSAGGKRRRPRRRCWNFSAVS
jgi:pimeloyl-ACP methyl ester carboxylesterase